jgi:penicillin V acylase-like amidase (Ntn superfamily)
VVPFRRVAAESDHAPLGAVHTEPVCARVFWNRNGVAAVCGRTLDWETSDDPRLWVIPRGTKRSGGTDPGAVNWATYYLSHLPAPADAAEAVAAVFGVVRNCQVPYGAPDSRFDTDPTWWDLVPAVLDPGVG